MSFKRAIVLALFVGVSLGAVAAAEGDSTWEKFKGYTHQQKNEAVAAGKKLVAEADKQIDELKKQTKNASAEAKAANEKNMKELQEKKAQAKAELAKLEQSGSGAWDATKTGFSNAYKDLHEAYDKAVAAVRK